MQASVFQSPRLDHLGERVTAAAAEDEVGPEVHRRPLVLARDGKRGHAGRLELRDGGEELVPGRRRGGDAGLLEEVLVVPEADHAHVPRDPVLDALVLVDAHRTRVDRVLPGGHRGGDVLEQAGVGLGGHGPAAPRLEEVGIGVRRGRGELGLEGLVLEDRDVDLHVGVGGRVGVGDGLEVGLAGLAGGDVPPVDGDRLGRGGRRFDGRDPPTAARPIGAVLLLLVLLLTGRDDQARRQHGQDHHGTPADRHDSTSSHSRSDVMGSTLRGERSRVDGPTRSDGQLLLRCPKVSMATAIGFASEP